MTNRFLSLDLRDIIFELLAPDQCYWEWKESSLPVIGDLNEFRLHMHSLPQYLRHRDEDRAKRADTPKWTTLNTAIIGFLPVGTTWRQTKRFCFITFDKYAHGRNRAKGNDNGECELCGRRDSLMHILGECDHPTLRSI